MKMKQDKQKEQSFNMRFQQLISIQDSEFDRENSQLNIEDSNSKNIQRKDKNNEKLLSCRMNKQGFNICVNKNCKKQAIICSDQKCDCEKDHPQCSFVVANRFLKNLQQKKQTISKQAQESFNSISEKIEKMAQQLNKLKKSIIKTKQTICGLKNFSKIVYELLAKRQYKLLTGQKFFEVKKQLEEEKQQIETVPSLSEIDSLWEQGFNKINKFFNSIKVLFRVQPQQNNNKEDSIQEDLINFTEKSMFLRLFRPEMYKKRNISIENWIQLSQTQILQNLVINTLNKNQGVKLIQNTKYSVKHLTLGNSSKSNQYLNRNLAQKLFVLRQLRTFCLVGTNIRGRQQEICSIIKNNKKLRTISFLHDFFNQNFSDKVIKCMADNLQNSLEHLSIQANTLITGQHLRLLKNLKILVLVGCKNIVKTQAEQAFSALTNLTHLDLRQSKFIDSNIINKIATNCVNLVYLNIHYSDITKKELLQIKHLKNLTCLCCGQNQINGQDLVQLTKHSNKITKLQITKLDVSNSQLLEINQNLSNNITHLNIQKCQKITVQPLLQMKGLKLVTSSFDNETRQKLREAKIITR